MKEDILKEYKELLAMEEEFKTRKKIFEKKLKENNLFFKDGVLLEENLQHIISYKNIIEADYVGEVGQMYHLSEGYLKIKEKDYNALIFLLNVINKEEEIQLKDFIFYVEQNFTIKDCYKTFLDDAIELSSYIDLLDNYHMEDKDIPLELIHKHISSFIIWVISMLTKTDEMYFYDIENLNKDLLTSSKNNFSYKDDNENYTFYFDLKVVKESEYLSKKYKKNKYNIFLS